MAILTDDIRAFIVRRLAAYDTPTQAARAVKAEFDVDVPRQQIEQYQPGKALSARGCAPRWKVMFERERQRFLEDTSDIPISHRTFRLRSLDRMARRAEETGNVPLAADLLERAAKEVGNFWSDHRSVAVTGADGGALRIETRHSHEIGDLAERSADDLVRLFSDTANPKTIGQG